MAQPINTQKQTKKLSKEQKKQVQKVLMTTFKNAMNGEVAVLIYQNQQYFMLRKDVLEEGIQNRGNFKPTKEQKHFNQMHNKLLMTMGKLQFDIKDRSEFQSDEEYEAHVKLMERNARLFEGLDEMTFEFTDMQNRAAPQQERQQLLDKFNKYFEDNPVLEKIFNGGK